MKKIGTREQVWNGEAEKTSGGITKADLFFDEKTETIKSIKASQVMRDLAVKRAENMRKNAENSNVQNIINKFENNALE